MRIESSVTSVSWIPSEAIGHTRMRLAGVGLTFCGVSLPDPPGEPEVGDGVDRAAPDEVARGRRDGG